MEVLLSNEDRFHRIRERLDDFIEKGIFVKILSTLFICTSNPKTAVCIRGLLVFWLNKTKVYARDTLATREALFSEYLITTGFQAEPVLMFGPSKERKSSLLQ